MIEDGQLAPFFKLSEFVCKCGCTSQFVVDGRLLEILMELRSHFNSPVTITSGFRCAVHNAKVKGSARSYHLKGMAADIKIKGVHPTVVYLYLEVEYPDTLGIGLYKDWVHVDSRTYRSRWRVLG